MLFETSRLNIRRFTLEDTRAVLDFNSNEEVTRYTGEQPLTTIEEAKAIVNRWLFEYDKYGYARMAVVHKKDKKIIGFAGLKYEEEWEVTDIGYRFLPEYWGKGIATEASLPFIFYGFNVLKLPKIVGVALTDNPPSSNVLRKLGLKLTKTGDVLNEGIDCQWHELNREDYQGMVETKKR